jgi:hypothetical protein
MATVDSRHPAQSRRAEEGRAGAALAAASTPGLTILEPGQIAGISLLASQRGAGHDRRQVNAPR